MKFTHCISLVLLLGSMAACGDNKDEDRLKREKDELASQNKNLQQLLSTTKGELTTAQGEITSLQARDPRETIAERDALLAAQTQTLHEQEEKLAEQATKVGEQEAQLKAQQAALQNADLTIAEREAAVKAAEATAAKLAADKAELQAQKQRVEAARQQAQLLATDKERTLQSLLKISLEPYSGIWILDGQSGLTRENCQAFVRIDAVSGSVFRATLCGTNEAQLEVQSVAGFSVIENADMIGQRGFSIATQTVAKSCGQTVSALAAGENLTFDHNFGTASPSRESASLVSSPLAGAIRLYRSGSLSPDLGKNKSCEVIQKRAQLASQQGNVLLQQAARVCALTPASPAGCFTDLNSFAPGAAQ